MAIWVNLWASRKLVCYDRISVDWMTDLVIEDALQGLARMLGASKTGAGGLQMWTRNMLNGKLGLKSNSWIDLV